MNEEEAQQEYFGVHTDNKETLQNALKRIEELEQENALLKGRNEGFEQQIMGLLIKYEEVYKRFPDLISAMDKAQTILKENTELKETLKTYNGCGDWDNDFHTCRVYLQHEELQELQIENATLKKQLEALSGDIPWRDIKDKSEVIGQLTEAKDLLSRWIDDRPYTVSEQKDLIADTEQFLKE